MADDGEDVIEWALLAQIEAIGDSNGHSGTWLRLVEQVLRTCRRRAIVFRDLKSEDRRSSQDAITDLTVALRTMLGELTSAQFPKPVAARLVADMRAWGAENGFSQLNELIAARALALAIDGLSELVLSPFTDRLRDDGELVLEADCIYPISRPRLNPKEYLSAAPTSDPAKLEDARLDETPHFALGDDATSRHRFVLDWDAFGRLGGLAPLFVDGVVDKPLVVAACQPNIDLDEFAHSEEEGEGTFRNRGPRDPGQGEVVLDQLRTATSQGSRVAVVPEYCLSAHDRDLMKAALEAMAQRPAVTVGGTSEVCYCEEGRHRDDSCDVINQAVIWVGEFGTVLTLEVPKQIPAHVGGLREAIVESQGEVRIFHSEGWNMCVLVCRDAMSNTILQQLARLNVNLLLVPAMTPRSTTLIQRACSLTAWAQALVVVANAPAVWRVDGDVPEGVDNEKRAHAAFQAPAEDMPGPLVVPAPDERPLEARGVWLWDLRERHRGEWAESS